MRRWGVMAAVGAAAALGTAMPGRAQAPPVAAPEGRPDVLLLVLPQSAQADAVDITYARTVPHAQAQRDLDALAQATGWALGPSRITDGPSPAVPGARMTSGVSAIAGGVLENSPVLPVEQVLTAFRAYKRLALIFNVGAGYQFQGPRDYADNDVRIALQQRGTLYTYQVQILNPQFTRLGLPRPASAGSSAPRRRSPWVLVLGILGASGAAGVLVYALMSRKTPPPPPPHAGADPVAEGRTKIGIKG